MTDLYQQAPGSKGYGPQDWEVVRRMAPGAMLLWVVPVEPDEIKAADAFNAEMVRITGKSSAVEMRAIHAALRAGVGEETP